MTRVRQLLAIFGVSLLGSFFTGFAVSASFSLFLGGNPYRVGFLPAGLGFAGLVACAVIPEGFVWYATRRRTTYRYLEALAWGVLVCVLIIVLSPFVTGFATLDRLDGFSTFVAVAFLACLPALLTVAPLTVWGWHRVTRASSKMAQKTLG